jgi:hypothetical protein
VNEAVLSRHVGARWVHTKSTRQHVTTVHRYAPTSSARPGQPGQSGQPGQVNRQMPPRRRIPRLFDIAALGADDWSSALLDPCVGRHSLGNHLRHRRHESSAATSSLAMPTASLPAMASIPSCSLISLCVPSSPSILGRATSSQAPPDTYQSFFNSTILPVSAGV